MPVIEEAKQPEQATLSVAEPDKGKYQRGEKAPGPEEEEAKKLKMGKGLVPDKKENAESTKLKPIPEKQVNKCSVACHLALEIKLKMILTLSSFSNCHRLPKKLSWSPQQPK